MPLTTTGFEMRTSDEIKASIVKRLKESYSTFLELPADIQNNIIDTGIQSIMEYENITNLLLNSFALNDSNEFLFKQMAQSLGLIQKEAFESQVELAFYGPSGTLIPAFTQVSDEEGSITFETQELYFIGDSGVVYIQALSESTDIANANTLTNILTNIGSSEVTCTNPSSSLAYVAAETSSQLKARAQALLRSPRKGGIEYAVAMLKSVEGVEERLISGAVREISKEVDGGTQLVNGIEMVIGGGSSSDIAEVLYKSFFESQKLISLPSDNDSSRTTEVTLSVYGYPLTIQFTRPLALDLSLQCTIALLSSYYSAETMQLLLEEPLRNYLTSLRVGERVGKVGLIKVILDTFEENNVDTSIVRSIDFTYAIGGSAYQEFDGEGKVSEVSYDTYIEPNIITINM